jgi:hypothetical protein
MPSSLPLPTISDLLADGAGALRGEKDRYGDARSGSLLNHIYGPTAILFAREADRDQDGFRAIYIDDADGDDLTNRVGTLLGVPRVVDTFGQGTATLVRSIATAGAGTFWKGTRIAVAGAPPSEYQVAADTAVGATLLGTTVPIQASVSGSGTAIQALSPGSLSFEDEVYDPLWTPASLVCADGTDFEPADSYRARARAQRLQGRNGYVPRIVQVCQAAGASFVLAFPSHYGLGNTFDTDYVDSGINSVYVADDGYGSPAALVNACAVALEGARVLGADVWVGGIHRTVLTIAATVTLTDAPGKLDTLPIRRALVQSLLAYFAPTGAGYTYKRTAMAGAMTRSHPAVQTVTFTSPILDVSLTPTAWPVTLTRYVVLPQLITLTFAPPV